MCEHLVWIIWLGLVQFGVGHRPVVWREDEKFMATESTQLMTESRLTDCGGCAFVDV